MSDLPKSLSALTGSQVPSAGTTLSSDRLFYGLLFTSRWSASYALLGGVVDAPRTGLLLSRSLDLTRSFAFGAKLIMLANKITSGTTLGRLLHGASNR